MKDVVKKIHDNTKSDAKANFQRQCYLETIIHRPVPDATAGLVDELSATVPDMEVRHQVARAIGMGGITKNMVPQIFDKAIDKRPERALRPRSIDLFSSEIVRGGHDASRASEA